jgi:hypothetical protein
MQKKTADLPTATTTDLGNRFFRSIGRKVGFLFGMNLLHLYANAQVAPKIGDKLHTISKQQKVGRNNNKNRL